MDHAESGAIYVNIGARLPREMEYELIETFRNLSQQIVWTYENGDINNFVPDNVLICQSLPNKIALAHKNTAVFVTEDNTIAVKQALHYGVPMLLVPFRNSEVIIHVRIFNFMVYFCLFSTKIRTQNLRRNFILEFCLFFLGWHSLVFRSNISNLSTTGWLNINFFFCPFYLHKQQLHGIIEHTALENMATIRSDEVKKEVLVQKLNKMLQNKNLKAQAKEISTLLHHNSVNLLNAESSNQRRLTLKERQLQRQQSSEATVHLDALGALFFVIFVIVKVSLRFCRFYNSWNADTSQKKPEWTAIHPKRSGITNRNPLMFILTK